jgi:hypothetical protein
MPRLQSFRQPAGQENVDARFPAPADLPIILELPDPFRRADGQRVATKTPQPELFGAVSAIGAGCYRLQAPNSETLAHIAKAFPYWFHPRLHEFAGKVERLPFDQHTVKALIAPRALVSTEALGDLWANPRGTQQSHAAAREVFAFLGASERIGIRFRDGGHEHNLDDWTALLDFADWQFFGKSPFDQSAFAAAERGYSWRAPLTRTTRRATN